MADTVDLGDRLEAVVAELVAKGRYSSRENALRESVRLLEEREHKLAVVNASLDRGLEDADRGRVTPASEIFDRLEAKYSALAAAKGE